MTKEKILELIEHEYNDIVENAIKDYGEELEIETFEDMKNYLDNMELYESEHYAFDSGALMELRVLRKLIEAGKE